MLVGNEGNDNDLNLKNCLIDFQSLKVKNGNVEFELSGKKQVFENIDLGIKSTGSTQIESQYRL